MRKVGKAPLVEAVTRPLANRFKDDLHNGGAKRGTCNKTFGSLRQYWKIILNRGHAEGKNPWDEVSVLKIEAKGTENAAIREYSDDELMRVLAAGADKDMHDAMIFAALTGARRGELFALTVADCEPWHDVSARDKE